MDFGSRVKELRRQQELTQREVADNLAVDFSYISKIENNRLDVLPSEDLIRRIAGLLQADAEELLNLAGKLDLKALQRAAIEEPEEYGVLLRRIQNRDLSSKQLKEIKNILDNK